jgi:nuclear pore complex protein Nup155
LGVHFYKNNEPQDDVQGKAAFKNRMECYQILLECFDSLIQQTNSVVKHRAPGQSSPQTPASQASGTQTAPAVNLIPLTSEEAREYSNFLLDEAIGSSDELLHVALYDWLYSHQQHDKLLHIKSPFLENYLKRKTSTFTESIALMDLLWMYYERNNHFRAAAEILNKLAERHSTEITLDQRLVYLSRAIVCMKSCQTPLSIEGFEAKPTGEFLHDLEEKMEVARIQLQILEGVSQLSGAPGRVADVISTLNSDLLDISRLYEVAESNSLPECQLAILYAANHCDVAVIEGLWKKIIEKELHVAEGNASDTQQAILSNKIKSLGRLYTPSEKYFPVGFLVSFIESRTQNMCLEPKWLAQTLLSLGFTLPFLFNIYLRLLNARQGTNMAWTRKQVQLLKVLAFLLSTFVENPKILARSEWRSFSQHALDSLSQCLSLMQLLQTDPDIRPLMSDFRGMQSKLERISNSC